MDRDAGLDAILRKAAQKREAAERAETAKLLAFKASGKAPFFDDVLHEMEALSRMREAERLPLEDLYERACWANPDVRALLLMQATSEARIDEMRKMTALAKSLNAAEDREARGQGKKPRKGRKR